MRTIEYTQDTRSCSLRHPQASSISSQTQYHRLSLITNNCWEAKIRQWAEQNVHILRFLRDFHPEQNKTSFSTVILQCSGGWRLDRIQITYISCLTKMKPDGKLSLFGRALCFPAVPFFTSPPSQCLGLVGVLRLSQNFLKSNCTFKTT